VIPYLYGRLINDYKVLNYLCNWVGELVKRLQVRL